MAYNGQGIGEVHDERHGRLYY